jgi:hypothetical protein
MMEILLTRIFSFTIWYHLAYLTISTALLGFGAAGSVLSSFPGLYRHDASRLAAFCTAGAGIALVFAIAILASRPLDPSLILVEPAPFAVGLLGYYVAITIPFFLAGIAVAAPLAAYPERVDRLYSADLLGAGLGCAAAVTALVVVDGAAAVFVCAAILVAAGGAYTFGQRSSLAFVALALALLLGAPFADRVLQFIPTPSKEFGKALTQPGTRTLFTRWSPVNRVDLFEKDDSRQSFWGNWGVGKSFLGEKPRVLSIQYDGHNGSNVFEVNETDSLELLDTHLLRTPYLINPSPRVLVIGVGGGIDVMNALRRGASKVTGAELQPITIELLTGPLVEYTGGSFRRSDVELVASEGRHFVRSSGETFDIIQITAVDTFSAQSTGAYVLAESYLYTVEAIFDYLDHLGEDGLLSIVVGDLAYRDEMVPTPILTRLALIVREALRRRGVETPGEHVVVAAQSLPFMIGGPVSGFVAADLLVKKSPFRAAEVERIQSYVDTNGFELRLAPGRPGEPSLTRIFNASNEQLAVLLGRQEFELGPVTDDRPFFYHFLPWSSLFRGERAIWYLPGSTTGLLMLVIMLVQALLLGSVLIVLPLWRGAREQLTGGQTVRFLLYFLSLGVGFMLIEISFVQKYVLVLGYPTYSLSVTIFSLLVFAAFGAWLSHLWWERPRPFLIGLLCVTVVLVCVEVLALPLVRDRLIEAPLPARICVTVLLQFPLGVALGMYFPTGIELVRRVAPRLVPWAWAVNGVASVASSVAAVVLGMTIGFSGVALVAAGIYAIGTTSLLTAIRGRS